MAHHFYTQNIVVEYATQVEDSLNGVDASLPVGSQSDRTLLLADGTTIVGVLETNLANLHLDNTEVAPAYVQKVGLYAEYFLAHWLSAPYLVRDPRLSDAATGVDRVRCRILGGGYHGETSALWDYIRLSPNLEDRDLLDDVPHEIVHRIQFRYNDRMRNGPADDDTLGIYGIVREGGALFCTENLHGALNRFFYFILKFHETTFTLR